MLKIKRLSFDDLSSTEKENVPDNGGSKEYTSYIKITHNENLFGLYPATKGPEDAGFYRDLSWIVELLMKCYNLGKQEGETK